MAAPRKYPDELRERATRLAVEARRDPASVGGAIKRIADQLGVHPEALRTWVKQAETDDGVRPGTTSAEAARVAELEREVRELRRANQILKSAASFFAAELCATRRWVDREVVRDRLPWVVAAA
ncbi:transposase [Amycolatopsis sp. K13G38]|uniref:Transposase n=1 Tax=Amycolatopsis acididurans TaxID=2724524 RepID=A0ABX1JG12_9PSEU|nr:transposase [Amycolatopsis acididurans]